jgi:peptide/nickel transport system substrate-binding protein
VHPPASTAALTAIFAAATLALTGCVTTSSRTSASGTQSATDTIRTTIDVPAGFDPAKTASLPDYLVARYGFDTLVRKDEGGLVPGLATEWTSTPTSATFTLRQDATCDDGTAITPTIVKKSLDYLAAAKTASPVAVTIFGPGNTPTITADDSAHTVKIEVPNPNSELATGLSIASTGIVCPAGLADPKALNAGPVKGANSGPYLLTDQRPGVSYTFTLRDDYKTWPTWRTAVPGTPAKTVVFTVSADPTATSNLVLDGQLDVAKINAESMGRFRSGDYSVSVNRFSDFYIVFNERPGTVFADPAARKAVAQAIDRTTFEKVASKGTGELSTWMSQKATPCATEDSTVLIPPDPAAAAAVLKGKKIRMVAPRVIGTNGAGNQYVQETLTAAGANVKSDNVDVGTWVGRVFGAPDTWDMTIFADLNFVGSLGSPLPYFLGPTLDKGGANLGNVDNPAVLKGFQAARAAADEAGRCAGYQSAIKALVGAADAVPLVNDPFIYAVRKGFSVQMLGGALDDPILRITGGSAS